ncbi:MAG: hypothetical protein H7328_07955 [Bdellovibrio sp.]|nr:hypothetical protein [Bdellovibrio sp.]
MKKTYLLYTVSFLTTLITACSGGGGGSSTGVTTGVGGTVSATITVPGIGTGGGAYSLGTLDGSWVSGCEGGANGDNWSYTRTMIISGNSVVQNIARFRQNQTCSGPVDVTEVISFTMAWGSYDSTGYSNNATYSNYSWLVTPVTSYGLARLGTLGACAGGSFTLGVTQECRTSTTASYPYYLADNVFLPVSQGPNLYTTTLGITYAFGTYRKVVSNPSAIDGIYAYTNGGTYWKLIISGDRYAYINADDSNSDRIFIDAGSLSAGPAITTPAGASSFALTTKSKLMQPRVASGATNLNAATACGFSDYANGIIKNLLLSGTCTSTPTHLMYKLTGGSLQFTFSNLPLPAVFSGPTLFAPWNYSP